MRAFFANFSLLALSFSFAFSASGEELIRTVSFSGSAENITVQAVPDNQYQLLIELSDPRIGLPVYALKGMIRYENVEGDGFLQLDNHFGSMGTFFTKSLAERGPLGKISGSSEWRPFVLPFYANSGSQEEELSPLPEKLSLSLFLPGSGTVSISGVGLYQYADGEDPLASAGQWMSGRNATLFAAFGGSFLGMWCALIGVMSARGKARSFVVGSTLVLLVTGILSLVTGIAAVATGQSYAVYYPLVLIGVLLVFLMAVLRKTFASRYEQMELKRMQSMDA